MNFCRKANFIFLNERKKGKGARGGGGGLTRGGGRQFNLSPVSTLLYRYGRRDVSRFITFFFPSPARPANGLLEIGTMLSTFSNATAVVMPAIFSYSFVSSFDFNNFNVFFLSFFLSFAVS